MEGTCRFNTRIDWILLPPISSLRREQSPTDSTSYNMTSSTISPRQISIEIAPDCEGYQVIDASDFTDHQLVIADLLISCPNSEINTT